MARRCPVCGVKRSARAPLTCSDHGTIPTTRGSHRAPSSYNFGHRGPGRHREPEVVDVAVAKINNPKAARRFWGLLQRWKRGEIDSLKY